MATTLQSYCYAAIVPKEGFIDPNHAKDKQKICYFKFNDGPDPTTDLIEATTFNPSMLVLPRRVTGQGPFPGNNVNAGAWLTQAIFLDRGFEPARASNGHPTDWFKIYLQPGQIDAIRFFLNLWPSGPWNLATEAGRRSLYNHLINNIFTEDSRAVKKVGRGGYNAPESDSRRDSALD